MSDCLVTVACAHETCGHVISFKTEVEQRLRRTHETWACPAGHRQHFSGRTDQERRISDLEADLRRADRDIDFWVGEARVCPFPSCRSYQYATAITLRRHLARAHDVNLEERLDAAWQAHWDAENERWEAERAQAAET